MDNSRITVFITSLFIFTFSSLCFNWKFYKKKSEHLSEDNNLSEDNKYLSEDNKYLSEDEELIILSKKKAYDILLDTMVCYWNDYPDGNFEDFMKEMWPSDFKIITNTDSKRDYSTWKDLLFMIKPMKDNLIPK